jgi:hypothetical protein
MPRKTLWTPAVIALLGTASDAAIAKRLGCSMSAVSDRRGKLGIRNHGRATGTCKWGQSDVNMLGRYADEEVAKITGRSLREVIAKRNELKR